MNGIEQKIARSFQGVKRDILEIKDNLLRLAENQEKLEAIIEELRNKHNLKKAFKKKITRKKK